MVSRPYRFYHPNLSIKHMDSEMSLALSEKVVSKEFGIVSSHYACLPPYFKDYAFICFKRKSEDCSQVAIFFNGFLTLIPFVYQSHQAGFFFPYTSLMTLSAFSIAAVSQASSHIVQYNPIPLLCET